MNRISISFVVATLSFCSRWREIESRASLVHKTPNGGTKEKDKCLNNPRSLATGSMRVK